MVLRFYFVYVFLNDKFIINWPDISKIDEGFTKLEKEK